jgi:hypothetical protein
MYVLVLRLLRRSFVECHDVRAPKLIGLFVRDQGAQAELCILRFDERIRELAVVLESAEALGRTAVQKLEPPFRGKAVKSPPGAALPRRFDQSTGQLTVSSQPVEILCRSAAQELELSRTPQRQFAGLATTFAVTAPCGEPVPGGFEPIKNLRHQMAASPASATTSSIGVKLLASKSSQARIFRHES